MSLFKKNKILVTHSGSFHSDDLFATAVLSILNKGNVKIIRTRDPKIIALGDYVYDIGGIYDADKNLFDHHQKDGAGKRDNGIPYASFGLIWKHFGLEICSGEKEAYEMIDNNIVAPIDAIDNGVDVMMPKFSGIVPSLVDQAFLINLPTWEEGNLNIDKIFKEQVQKVKVFLEREIKVALSEVKGKKIILEAYEKAQDKRVIELGNSFPRYLFQKVLSTLPEPIYLIYPSESSDSWKIEAIRKDMTTMDSRKLLPKSWCGLRDGDSNLKEVTGVSDIIFCHRNGFLAMATSKEGVKKLADLALSNQD